MVDSANVLKHKHLDVILLSLMHFFGHKISHTSEFYNLRRAVLWNTFIEYPNHRSKILPVYSLRFNAKSDLSQKTAILRG